jgi:hypothetical protein
MLSNKYIKNKTIKIWGATVVEFDFLLSFGGWNEGEAKFVAAPGRFSLIFQCVLWLFWLF